MPKHLHDLTELQLRILDVVWSRGTATAVEVHEELSAETGLARKTFGTILSRLEKQGFLRHDVEGREFVYRATVTRESVRRATVRNLLRNLFNGNLGSLVSEALDVEGVKPGDVRKARELIATWQKRTERT